MGAIRESFFVLMVNDFPLEKDMIDQIKFRLRTAVVKTPSKQDYQGKRDSLPINGKKVEVAVKKIIEGKTVTSQESLSNRDS